ncbi:MAG: tetratricopeptide repeat protein, partial [Myxococcota bacterium]
KPSIAVLPFANMSGDPEQAYFADGITEDLITGISCLPGLFVISRNSSFTYKGKPAKLIDVGRALGVRYILEGSVRTAGGRVRITAQLVDAEPDRHLWAERYDRPLEDIFAVQDDVTREIIGALEVNLGERDEGALTKPVTDNLEAYDCFLRGISYLARTSKENHQKAREMLKQAISHDQNLAHAYSLLALSRIFDWIWQWTNDPGELQKAFAEAQQAVALDKSISTPHAVLGLAYTFGREYDKGLAEAKKAVALNPNDADAQAALGSVYTLLCQPEAAIPAAERALRLDPHSPTSVTRNYLTLGNAYRMTGQLDEAARTFQAALKLNPDFMAAHILLTTVYVDQGRRADARREVSEILRINPDFSLTRAPAHSPPYRDPAVRSHVLESLRKAGLRE